MDINKFALSVFDHFLEETKKIYVFIEEKNQKGNAKRGTDIYIYISTYTFNGIFSYWRR